MGLRGLDRGGVPEGWEFRDCWVAIAWCGVMGLCMSSVEGITRRLRRVISR